MSKLVVVGIGPGSKPEMTGAALDALAAVDVVAGYTTYVNLVKPLLPENTEYLVTGMRSEIERCQMAIDEAEQGRNVAMVCSGDPGVYGMAGLIYELAAKTDEQGVPSRDFPFEIEVIPGVTAASSGASRLGAPLMQDFAVISLSDLLCPWEVIERRLAGAAAGGLVIVLYNPGSRTRTDHLARACDIILKERGPETVCGLVDHIGREGQTSRLLTLGELRDTEVQMVTTVFIGNERTRNINGKMVTLRGYERKERA